MLHVWKGYMWALQSSFVYGAIALKALGFCKRLLFFPKFPNICFLTGRFAIFGIDICSFEFGQFQKTFEKL